MLTIEVDELLEKVYAQASRIKAAKHPEQVLRELMEPVRIAVQRFELDHASHKVDPARLQAQHYWTEAATKIQAIVRGKHQRGLFSRQLSLRLQGTKVGMFVSMCAVQYWDGNTSPFVSLFVCFCLANRTT